MQGACALQWRLFTEDETALEKNVILAPSFRIFPREGSRTDQSRVVPCFYYNQGRTTRREFPLPHRNNRHEAGREDAKPLLNMMKDAPLGIEHEPSSWNAWSPITQYGPDEYRVVSF